MRKISVLLPLFILIVMTAFHFLYRPEIAFTPAIFRLRLNVYVAELLTAFILAACGYILQTLMLNPLAEPFILGVSGGASFGAVIAVFAGLVPLVLFRTAFSLIGALIVTGIILLLGRRRSGFSMGLAVLAGIGFNSLFSGLIMLTQSLLSPNNLHSSIGWLMGNIDHLLPAEIVLLFVGAVLPALFLLIRGREMDIYLSGDEMAQAVGVDTARLKTLGFVAVSISAGLAVSVTGMIGFIGLMVPHIVKLSGGVKHRTSLIPLFLSGSSLMVLAGLLSKIVVPGTVLPIGVITSVIGAPVFLILLVRKYKGV